MKGSIIWKKRVTHMAAFLLIAGTLAPFDGITMPSSVQARTTIRLSVTKKSYFLHGVWDKLTLKNVPSGAKIRWKSSDRKVVRIREHIKNGIWYQVKQDGTATLTATYRGKKYRCGIRVKKESSDTPTPEPTDVSETVGDDVDTEAPETTEKPTKSPSPTAPAGGGVVISENQKIYDQKIADFKERYISEGMSEYDKVDAICRFISYEFDYDGHEASWFAMVIKGAGDCAASRVGVYELCKDLGVRTFICNSSHDHGETMVRIDDDVYMTVTGYAGVKPRNYRLYKMSDMELSGYLDRYPASKYLLGLA